MSTSSSSHTTRGGGGYYNLLAVNRDASVDDIKRAYKRAALIHHPDKGGDEEMFKLIKQAFEVLSNTNTRYMYNKSNQSDGIIMSRKQEQQQQNRDDNGKGCSRSVDDNSSSSMGTRQQQQTNSHLREDDDEVYSVMSIKELKGRLMKMGIRHEDCIEKHDLIQRLLLSTTKASTVYKTAPGRPSRRGVGRGGGGIEHNDDEDYRPNGRDVYTCKGMDDNIIIDNTNIDNPIHLLAAPRYKIITMGAEAVGKSCIVKRYCEGRFIKRYISTIGIDYGVKGVRYTSNSDMNNGVMKINLFDMAGHDEFKDIRMEFYDNIQGGLLVYDVTSIAS
ncbi:DnaJ sub C member 27 [Perkinsus olseni]|uniref:DnaJ sub C member 27 n=1 Tax=Perkinsus olseni TaxID=32597 RepID=A0A7J6U369_PEROL|nr:DnaJ sub C member 27 [Perkinsus olseni]